MKALSKARRGTCLRHNHETLQAESVPPNLSTGEHPTEKSLSGMHTSNLTHTAPPGNLRFKENFYIK